jgi:hypothetical protein
VVALKDVERVATPFLTAFPSYATAAATGVLLAP